MDSTHAVHRSAARVRPAPAPNDLPVVVSGPGDYVSRDGRRITVHEVRAAGEPDTTVFAATGSVWREFRGKVRPRGFCTWHVSGRRLPLDEAPSDIVGPWMDDEGQPAAGAV